MESAGGLLPTFRIRKFLLAVREGFGQGVQMDVKYVAEKYFDFKIMSIQTDNGGEFRGDFHNWLNKQNIPHYFIPKKSPYWNAQVERVHKTIDDEYYQNPIRIWKTPYEWLEYYNFERIHLTLNGLTPQEKYLQSVTLDC